MIQILLTSSDIPPTLTKQQYVKPSFNLFILNMESPLLAGSGTPTSKKSPISPIEPSGEDW